MRKQIRLQDEPERLRVTTNVIPQTTRREAAHAFVIPETTRREAAHAFVIPETTRREAARGYPGPIP